MVCRITMFLLVSLFLLPGAAFGTLPASGPFRPVALTGTDGLHGPGLGVGIEFDRFDADDELFANPVMNGRGDILFRATLRGAGVTTSNDGGLWLCQDGRLVLLVREGDPVPGMAGVHFKAVADWAPEPVLCDSGKVLFAAFLEGTGVTSTTEEALFWGDRNGIRMIARQWVTELPDRPGVFLGRDIATKNMFTTDPMLLTRDGNVVVRLGVHPGGGPNSYYLATLMFSPDTGAIRTLAYGGDSLPGNRVVLKMSEALVGNDGAAAGRIEYQGTSSSGGGIFTERTGTLEEIYAEDGYAPGGGIYGPLYQKRIAVTREGKVAFYARGADPFGYDGRFFSEGPFGYNIPFGIAETGEPAPGVSGGRFGFLDNGPLLLADNGTALFIADLWDVPATSNRGVWTNSSGIGVNLEIRKGDAAPGFGGAAFKEFGPAYINAQGQILLVTTLSNSFEVLWIQTIPGGSFTPLASTYVKFDLFGDGSDLRTVEDIIVDPIAPGTTLVLFPSDAATGDGQRIPFNDSGDLVARLKFFGGTEGIFATGAALRCIGDVLPGAGVTVQIAGRSQASPVLLALGSGIRVPPLPTAHGDLRLILPLAKSWSLGAMPASGLLSLPMNVPAGWVSGAEYPFQALVGPWGGSEARLTNLLTLTVQ
jgi:hypothetical protein